MYSELFAAALPVPDVERNPLTRTDLAVTQKDEARNAAAALVRLYSIQIKYNRVSVDRVFLVDAANPTG